MFETIKRDIHRFDRAAYILSLYPDIPEELIAKAIGILDDGDSPTYYPRAVALLSYDPSMSSKVLHDCIGCALGSADNYRSWFKTWNDAELMQDWANESSRNSKRKKRAEKRGLRS